MRWERAIFEVQYKVFDVGEKVTPTSPRCPLDPGVYTVTKCHKPLYEGDETVVFVEGHATGVSGEYLTSVENPAGRPDGDTLVEKLRELFEDHDIGVYPEHNENGADTYNCPCCCASKPIQGYSGDMELMDFIEHKPECKLMQLYRLVQASAGV